MRRFFVGLAITAMLGMIPGQARGNDRQISQTIVKSLQAEQKNKNLNGFNIDLEVEEGAVYLKGTVATEEQEKLTLDIVRRVEGVTQVYNELEIATPKKPSHKPESNHKPAKLLEAVEVAELPKVLPAVEQAVVAEADEKESDSKVSETIDTLDEINAAAPKVDQKATPAAAIMPANSDLSSRELATRIIAKLKQEKSAGHLSGFTINVEVDRGIACLKGQVTSVEQQTRVLDLVRRVPGVKQVMNGLTIAQPGTAQSPTDIAQLVVTRIEEKKSSGQLKNFSVDVEVDHGVVWLTGQAASEAQQQIILDAARYVPGVTKVVNDLVVKAPIVQAQQAIAATAKAAINDRQEAAEPSVRLPPQPLPLEDDDGPIGSAVASGSAKETKIAAVQPPPATAPIQAAPGVPIPAPSLTPALQPAPPTLQAAAPSQPTVQYVWVPASQMPNGQLPANFPLAAMPQAAAAQSQVAQMPVPMPARQMVAGQTAGASQIPARQMPARPAQAAATQMPLAFAPANAASHTHIAGLHHGGVMHGGDMNPVPINESVPGVGIGPARYDHPQMPQYAWPSYAPHPNYGAVTYPKQYSPMAWPYIGPFYPYPQVPLGWRKVELKWKDGWWQLDFKDRY